MKFSVVIPAYNVEKYIDKAIKSVLGQENIDLDDIEIIIIDDGSIDQTRIKVEEWCKKFPKTITLYSKENGNWGSVINYVKNKKLVNNEIVSILDADDFYLKKTLYYVSQKIKDNDVLSGSLIKYNGIDFENKIKTHINIFSKKIINRRKFYTTITCPAAHFYKSSLFYKIEDLAENKSYQDSILLYQILNISKTMFSTPKVLSAYFYNREGNSVGQEWDDKRYNCELDLIRYYLKHNLQEIAYIHLMDINILQYCNDNSISFNINRKFNFLFLPTWYRLPFIVKQKMKKWKMPFIKNKIK